MAINNLTLQFFHNKADSLPSITNDPYIGVYEKLLTSVQKLNDETEDSLIAISHMVYGWMPTILTFAGEEISTECFYKNVKTGSLDEEFLEKLKKTINNSVAGSSKLLHFTNPKDYPIWDSRVYKSINNENPYQYRVNNVENYIEYTKKLREIRDSSDVKQLKTKMQKLGYCTDSTTNIRVLELILFYG